MFSLTQHPSFPWFYYPSLPPTTSAPSDPRLSISDFVFVLESPLHTVCSPHSSIHGKSPAGGRILQLFPLHYSRKLHQKEVIIHEAWLDPKWKEAVLGELQALDRNGTWKTIQRPTEKFMWGVSGSIRLNIMSMDWLNNTRQGWLKKRYTQTYRKGITPSFIWNASWSSTNYVLQYNYQE